jgi:hypothetical protein
VVAASAKNMSRATQNPAGGRYYRSAPFTHGHDGNPDPHGCKSDV